MLPEALTGRTAGQAKQVAGRLCLDFANIVGGWHDALRPREDRLTEYVDLVAWSRTAGLVDDAGATRLWRESQKRPREAAAVLERARRLRAAIHGVAWCFERGTEPRRADLDVLADEARRARGRQVLEPSTERLAWRFEDDGDGLDPALGPVALSAEEYFTTADLSRLHACPGEGCGWHFEDATRNRSRQWCDMGDCGNVAKVRRFRSRQRAVGRKR
jgi:predicted RNA-binding Zn ribbon-like protein